MCSARATGESESAWKRTFPDHEDSFGEGLSRGARFAVAWRTTFSLNSMQPETLSNGFFPQRCPWGAGAVLQAQRVKRQQGKTREAVPASAVRKKLKPQVSHRRLCRNPAAVAQPVQQQHGFRAFQPGAVHPEFAAAQFPPNYDMPWIAS